MRLLLFCGAQQWGGAEIFLGHLIAGFSADVQPTLLGVDAEVLERIARRRPGTVVQVVPRIDSRRDLAPILAQRRAMAAARPDIVQLNLPVPFAEPYSVLAALTVRRSKVVVVEHLPMPIQSPRIRFLKRLSARRLSAHVAVGTAAARDIEVMSGRPPGSIRVVHNGIPPVRLREMPRPADTDFVVGGIGRLHRQKGFDLLVRAMVRLPGAHLLLVGDGPEREPLQALADELGVAERMTITGWSDRSTDWLSAMDAVALPSRFEGLPLVLLEAMACGRAVVGTNVGSIGDALLDERTGLVVPLDDEVALAAALNRLREDPDLRSRLGAAAAGLARERFTLSGMVGAYEALYAELLRKT
jgi:glycosyltransferase involved in cell wall biosynthesis